ncbi:DUF2726 domain-containing protein [Micromonospora sp. CPCC 206060]|uniref:DUF2726 domain-containing protein n=1 Tax=Micromonospora sp. CPCC 206060 TaxID=3122406 RepID=UPI002FF154D6
MTATGNGGGGFLRPLVMSGPAGDGGTPGRGFERGDWVVLPDQSLGALVHARPPEVTGSQWNTAIRTRYDFVACDRRTGRPVFAVELSDPDTTGTGRSGGAERADRMRTAVCDAVGLEVLRIVSPILRPAGVGRRIVEYLLDARSYATAVRDAVDPTDPLAEPAVGYRDIIGRLPDGRDGFVNDLGALARAAAVDAYVSRRLTDPILRGLYVHWVDGPAEGWGWVEVGEGRCLFERVLLWPHRFSCGVPPERLAEDLAAVAIGERLRSADPVPDDRAEVARRFTELGRRRAELVGGFAFDHLSFG